MQSDVSIKNVEFEIVFRIFYLFPVTRICFMGWSDHVDLYESADEALSEVIGPYSGSVRRSSRDDLKNAP